MMSALQNWLRAASGRVRSLLSLVTILVSAGSLGMQHSAVGTPLGYAADVQPLLDKYCYSCHGNEKQKADLNLQDYKDVEAVRGQRDLWAEVMRKVRNSEMPPEGKPQPTDAERTRITSWIEQELFPVDCSNPDPGRVTIRRLNRNEYNNTIRDLLGVTFRPADDFPADDTGYGFDNIGDALSVSPLLLEKYLAAAEKIVDQAPLDSRIFFLTPGPDNTNKCSSQILERFASRAYRRPLQSGELDRLERIAEDLREDGSSFEESIKVTIQAILVSPRFLFRGEIQEHPDDPANRQPVDEYALASRLSYFLWSSMPDEQLFALAAQGKLRQELTVQVSRMLADPKSSAFVANFAGQWLQTRMLKDVAPDPEIYPGFDDELRQAMARETEMFFENVLKNDCRIFEFLTADYTFINERLAKHYGLKGVEGPEFRRVSLQGMPRGGVLTHGSVLTLTANPTRTSPVKRGKWVLENLLAQAPPPPPPDVPPLVETKHESATATLRERMERHRADPACASCHSLMDPIGFSLENFDGIGAWRDKEGAFPIDASGRLNTGETFDGATELRALLASQRRVQFVRCISEKMLTYALGRGLEYYDKCALDQIGASLETGDYRFSALVHGIVNSTPFQMRRGEGRP